MHLNPELCAISFWGDVVVDWWLVVAKPKLQKCSSGLWCLFAYAYFEFGAKEIELLLIPWVILFHGSAEFHILVYFLEKTHHDLIHCEMHINTKINQVCVCVRVCVLVSMHQTHISTSHPRVQPSQQHWAMTSQSVQLSVGWWRLSLVALWEWVRQAMAKAACSSSWHCPLHSAVENLSLILLQMKCRWVNLMKPQLVWVGMKKLAFFLRVSSLRSTYSWAANIFEGGLHCVQCCLCCNSPQDRYIVSHTQVSEACFAESYSNPTASLPWK